MSAREIIQKAVDEAFAGPSTSNSRFAAAQVAKIIERHLSSAGFRILGPDEVDAVTVACEQALPYVSRYESEHFSNVALDTMTKLAAAIRALKGGGA